MSIPRKSKRLWKRFPRSAAGLAVYAYVVPFLISTAGGAIISAVLILSLKKANILAGMQEALREEKPAHV